MKPGDIGPRITAMGRKLSDAPESPGLEEMKNMERLSGKAPCLARLKQLAEWSAKEHALDESNEGGR